MPPAVREMFQSTPAHDGRPGVRAFAGDYGQVSIHARTRRATCPCIDQPAGCCDVSIHARTRRATSSRPSPRGTLSRVSIHARTRRATRLANGADVLGCFNPRPHTTGDESSTALLSPASFNPRPHTTGDCHPPKLHPGNDLRQPFRERNQNLPIARWQYAIQRCNSKRQNVL